jgi:6-phosphogluconolactonase
MTFETLAGAREVWFLVAGRDKATAVARGVGGDDVQRTPAAGVHGRERTVWLVDADAAAELATG